MRHHLSSKKGKDQGESQDDVRLFNLVHCVGCFNIQRRCRPVDHILYFGKD